jgi:hypothetical protein
MAHVVRSRTKLRSAMRLNYQHSDRTRVAGYPDSLISSFNFA